MPTHDPLSRRGLLQAAGGFTFFALAPSARALGEGWEPFLAPAPGGPARPVLTAVPYLQPGPNAGSLTEGRDSMVVAWQTDTVPAEFKLSYGSRGDEHQAEVTMRTRSEGYGGGKSARRNYTATLSGLELGKRVRYKVTMNGERLVEGFFTTRKPRGAKARFVAFGDNSFGDPSDRAIAFQAFSAMPDFVMNTGDTVYDNGRDSEYGRYFFPVYNADEPGPRLGAPLLRSVPLYSVLANHDLNAPGSTVDFDRQGDALGWYTNFHFPLNGPEPTFPTPIKGAEARVREFREAAGDRYPRMANYSFDYGDGHFLCLDSNLFLDPTDPALQAWIERDLKATDAAWRFVVYHHPAFNVGNEHYDEQHMRVLSPVFERGGVDVVLSGHEHNYQRTRPLRFAPRDVSGAKKVAEGTRLVPGDFTVDRAFDGDKARKADGIVYITTGAGGKYLYDLEMNGNPSAWLHKEDADADYVAKMVSDRHSLTVFDMDARTLTLRQVDEWGQEVDRAVFTKG